MEIRVMRVVEKDKIYIIDALRARATSPTPRERTLIDDAESKNAKRLGFYDVMYMYQKLCVITLKVVRGWGQYTNAQMTATIRLAGLRKRALVIASRLFDRRIK